MYMLCSLTIDGSYDHFENSVYSNFPLKFLNLHGESSYEMPFVYECGGFVREIMDKLRHVTEHRC